MGRGEPLGGLAGDGTYVLKGNRLTVTPPEMFGAATVDVEGDELIVQYDDNREVRYKRLGPLDPTRIETKRGNQKN